jgi:prepilin-type N-terminal cleavage/methylation domain-containing protein
MSGRYRCGYTLVELSLVVLILGIMAAAVVPYLISSDSGKLQVAAQEIADAMRFARSEAMRLRQPHGFRQKTSDRSIRVFRPDTGSVPWIEVYDIYHPVSKKLYDIRLDGRFFAAADSISAVREYRGTCNRVASVYFDANGIPRCLEPQTVLLDRFEVTLKIGDHQRVVSLQPITGRVAIQ